MGNMDKPIHKKTWTTGRFILIACVLLIMAAVAYFLASRSGKSRLKADPSRMTFSKVGYGEFREYYPFDAKVEPVTSVYLDVESGGRVEQIFTEGGKFVKKGDLILQFSNAQLQRNSIDTESRLLETLDIQRNTQLNRAKDKLAFKESLLNLDYEILRLEDKYKRYKALKDDAGVLSEDEFKTVEDQLMNAKNRRDLPQF